MAVKWRTEVNEDSGTWSYVALGERVARERSCSARKTKLHSDAVEVPGPTRRILQSISLNSERKKIFFCLHLCPVPVIFCIHSVVGPGPWMESVKTRYACRGSILSRIKRYYRAGVDFSA
jgi:hypothetical protein